MDLLIDFLVLIFRALLDQNKPRQTPTPPVTRTPPADQDPFADPGDRLRGQLTLLGFVALAILVAVWLLLLRGAEGF